MRPRGVTAFMPPATMAAASSPSLPRNMASSCKSMSCEKCYVSKSKCDFNFPCERCFRLNLPCRPRVRGGRRREESLVIEEQEQHQYQQNGQLQSMECLGGPGSTTSTEEADDDDDDDEEEEEEEEQHTRAISWTSSGKRVSKKHTATSSASKESSSKKSKKGSEVKSEVSLPSLVDLVLERVNGGQMSANYLQAFYTLQQRGCINREGMLVLLRHAKRLSKVCGGDVTLGAADVIAKALRMTPQELKGKEEERKGDSCISNATYASERSRRKQMVEEVRMWEAAAARLKASPLFQERDDGRTAMVVIEMDRAKARVVAVGNQAYLDVFPSPAQLFSQGMARRCWSPFLFAAFVAHGDREAWFRVNMEAMCSATPRGSMEGGGREGQNERQLYSEFVKIFGREGQVFLYWARLAQLGGEGGKQKKQLHEEQLQQDDHEEGREDGEAEDEDQEEVGKEEGRDESLYFVLRMDQMPPSRHITDRPERSSHSKTTFFRQHFSHSPAAAAAAAAATATTTAAAAVGAISSFSPCSSGCRLPGSLSSFSSSSSTTTSSPSPCSSSPCTPSGEAEECGYVLGRKKGIDSSTQSENEATAAVLSVTGATLIPHSIISSSSTFTSSFSSSSSSTCHFPASSSLAATTIMKAKLSPSSSASSFQHSSPPHEPLSFPNTNTSSTSSSPPLAPVPAGLFDAKSDFIKDLLRVCLPKDKGAGASNADKELALAAAAAAIAAGSIRVGREQRWQPLGLEISSSSNGSSDGRSGLYQNQAMGMGPSQTGVLAQVQHELPPPPPLPNGRLTWQPEQYLSPPSLSFHQQQQKLEYEPYQQYQRYQQQQQQHQQHQQQHQQQQQQHQPYPPTPEQEQQLQLLRQQYQEQQLRSRQQHQEQLEHQKRQQQLQQQQQRHQWLVAHLERQRLHEQHQQQHEQQQREQQEERQRDVQPRHLSIYLHSKQQQQGPRSPSSFPPITQRQQQQQQQHLQEQSSSFPLTLQSQKENARAGLLLLSLAAAQTSGSCKKKVVLTSIS